MTWGGGARCRGECQHLPMLNLAMAIRKQYLPRSVVSLLMVLWHSGKNVILFAHVICPRVQCSILDVVTIFDYIYDGDSHGNHSGRLQDSDHFCWNSLEKVGISMELKTKMAEAPANCFPLKFHGIPWNSDFPLGIQQNLQELMEEGKDLKKA